MKAVQDPTPAMPAGCELLAQQRTASPTLGPDRGNSVRCFGCRRHGHFRRDWPDLRRNSSASLGNEYGRRPTWFRELRQRSKRPRILYRPKLDCCQFSSPGSCYRDVYGAPTNGSQDCYGGPPERDGASGGPRVANMSPQAVEDQPGKLLNLLCLYGNVVKIKFLEIKNGCPIVQIEDHLAKERALPFKPPDDTPPFKEFMGNCNNRISKLETTYKNRIPPPMHRHNPSSSTNIKQ
ncbi:hypothetical protein HPB47_017432 [Ixodes persulcatus]|uniref:Uncharacterized protein n=1 Tax=Ixodes persulcatus TaxID=34615 RepID=A0AC60QP79_IXOPE|nr:hypothetical protein HPB47_017432 [Ixodes persulcatus]